MEFHLEATKYSGVEIVGYFPGVIGEITQMHAVYYHENWGFDITFETQVGRELSEFLANFQKGRDGFWAARSDNRFAGAVAIDGSLTRTEGARLRWFIVEPGSQGSGIGRRLIEHALAFCREAHHKTVFLWTFKGLEAARRLYEQAGFVLDEEHDVEQWGGVIREQKFVLTL